MCFRTLFLQFLAVLLPVGPARSADPDSAPRRVETRLVSRDPGILEIRAVLARGEHGEVRVFLPSDEPDAAADRNGAFRVPLRPVSGGDSVQSARFELPGRAALGAGTRPGVRIELWSDDGTGWELVEGHVMTLGPAGAESVPDWAKGIVWYQVFPERFRNGNASNDPHAWDRTVLAWDAPFRTVSTEEIEMHWNRRLVDPRAFPTDPGRWAGGWGALGQVIFQRRYGGDLQGVFERLDHIAALGAGGLYLCPVFEGRSLHKYDASDHRHIDPTLGDPGVPGTPDRSGEDPLDETTWGWEPGDTYLVDVILPAARERGLRVILDGVWNHVGRDHFAFQDVLERGRDSAFADWFKVEFDDEGRVLRYEAWDRPNGALPEFRQTREGDLAPGPKAHVFAVTRRWMDPDGDGDPSDGVDGWRLDVAAEVGRAFWRDWRAHVRSINPDAVLIGEIWDDAELWFNGVAFDAQMNYPLAYPIADWLAIGQRGTDAAAMAERIRGVIDHHPAHDAAQMTLIASHDTERGASLMQNDTARAYDSGATPWLAGSTYDAGPVDDDARRRLLAAFALLTALPGSPLVYNGDEFAMAGADDPDNRRPIPWPDGSAAGGAEQEFPGSLRAILRLRADPRLADLLRFGLLEIGAIDADRVLVRRVLGGRMLEVGVARSGEPALGEVPDGWKADVNGANAAGQKGSVSVVVWRLLLAESGR